MISSRQFKEIIRDIIREELGTGKNYKIGTIADVNGKPTIRFAGEDQPSQKKYSFINSYKPTPGDRVLLAGVSGSYVVLGKISQDIDDPDDPVGGNPIIFEQDLVLRNGWENYGSSFGNAGVRKFKNGMVQIYGLIRYGETGATITAADLPPGCAPLRTEIFLTAAGSTGGTAVIYVNESYGIRVVSATSDAFVSLAGIYYYAGE